MRISIVATLTVVQYALLASLTHSVRISPRLLDNKITVVNDDNNSPPAPPPSERLSPIILIPGDGGSRLQAKLDRTNVQHHYCEKNSKDWFDLWLNLSLLVPFALDCWLDNMKLVYNATTRTSHSAPGVNIRVSGFGKVEPVEYVDPAKVHGTSYFDAIVRRLVELGYERNKNIFGAPYDFRLAPNQLQQYFIDLNKLIEDVYRSNGNEPVVMMCHSMGCLNILHFLNNKSQAWKDRYIRSMVSLSGAWGGSVKALKAFASGDNFGVVVIPSLSLRRDVRTFPSLAYLLPTKEIWPENQVLVKKDKHLYTINDYKRFFNDMKYPTGWDLWSDVRNLTNRQQAPGVEIHCLHGHKVNTVERLDYEAGNFPDGQPTNLYGDGDGTVNLISLQACVGWATRQKQPLFYKNFTNIDHMSILTDNNVLDYIGESLVKPLKRR